MGLSPAKEVLGEPSLCPCRSCTGEIAQWWVQHPAHLGTQCHPETRHRQRWVGAATCPDTKVMGLALHNGVPLN